MRFVYLHANVALDCQIIAVHEGDFDDAINAVRGDGREHDRVMTPRQVQAAQDAAHSRLVKLGVLPS